MSFTLSLGGHVSLSGAFEPQGILPSDKTFVRVLHEPELAANLPHTTPPKRPEVRPFFPNHHVPFEKKWQLLSKAMNPLLSAGNWTAVYHYQLWIANNQGFGMESDPRANFVEGTHLKDKLPRVEALTCGGNLLRVMGETSEDYLVDTLDWHQAAPTVEWMNSHPWLVTWAVKLAADGTPRPFQQGEQPNGYIPGVRHPLLADPLRFVVTIPKWRVVRWTARTVPDPYKLYL